MTCLHVYRRSTEPGREVTVDIFVASCPVIDAETNPQLKPSNLYNEIIFTIKPFQNLFSKSSKPNDRFKVRKRKCMTLSSWSRNGNDASERGRLPVADVTVSVSSSSLRTSRPATLQTSVSFRRWFFRRSSAPNVIISRLGSAGKPGAGRPTAADGGAFVPIAGVVSILGAASSSRDPTISLRFRVSVQFFDQNLTQSRFSFRVQKTAGFAVSVATIGSVSTSLSTELFFSPFRSVQTVDHFLQFSHF